ncbi:hypothetical protein IE53DRAFT_162257 [Violaceomyces palustris]|uniref:Uncharacterized protein n=1 Tax=Violaceomyces palustris TaxID=1673888 RepID=A0ACD0NTN1_9BASI|nr:hypothetical protein IE53DRAFT_162257 [Violaceomyces palustris]
MVEALPTSTMNPQEWACPCLNVKLSIFPLPRDVEEGKPWAATLSDLEGIQATFPLLTSRETASFGGGPSLACVRCLNCSLLVYGAAKPAPPGPARTYGFITNDSPSKERSRSDGRSQETFVKPIDGKVWILPGAVGPDQVAKFLRSESYSPAFKIVIDKNKVEESSTLSEPTSPTNSTDEFPSRGRLGANRRSSLTQIPNALPYTLPTVPSHLISTPPQSPKPGGGASHPSTPTSLLVSGGLSNPLVGQLEASALESLRDFRAKAEAEIFELVRQKRREMEVLEKRTKEEAKVLLVASRSRASGNGASAQKKSSFPVTRQPPVNGVSVSRDSLTTAAEANESGRGGDLPQSNKIADSEELELPPSAFERRSTFSNRASASTPALSSSLSALSASFAMRGRDPPKQMEDWANKRRLMERYPEGDHSALTSAVTSAVNSDEEQEEDESDSAERGRGRASRRSNQDDDDESPKAPENRRGRGRQSAGDGAPSSSDLLSKGPPLVSVDTGERADKDMPKVDGQAVSSSPSEPSVKGTLQPREPPSSSAEPLKPATKSPTSGKRTSASRTKSSGEKKVAFAETTEEGKVAEVEEESEESERELVDEEDAAVFEIDEEADGLDEGGEPGEEGDDAITKDENDSGRDSDAYTEDDEDDADVEVPGMGAASFSALSASQSAFPSSLLAAAGDSGFDPASLRLDGRVVADPSLGVNGGGNDKLLDASMNLRRSSVVGDQLLSSSSRGRSGDPANISTASGSRSNSRNRASKKSDDPEARLSGLLAPHAPSHRNLWSGSRKKGKAKYELDEEDDQRWAAWQERVRQAEEKAKDSDDSLLARSMPMAVGPPNRFRAPGVADLIADATEASEARNIGIGISIGQRYTGYGSMHDKDIGFEREPKTSLPYKERMMVPSLRKAIRRNKLEAAAAGNLSTSIVAQPRLETIEDLGDAEVSPTTTMKMEPIGARSIGNQSPTPASFTTRGALPGSLITRGFVAHSGQQPTLSVPLTGVKGGESRSGTSTPSSSGRRSPRPPYIPPPPPTSSSIVLESDPVNAPAPLQVFLQPADKDFAEVEDDEEAETEEGWGKVLHFMHRLQMLKKNKRTGWLHHRIKNPESISDHMYRMAILCMLCPNKGVDIGKCVQLALVHDLAEAEVGDLTPLDGVGKEEKSKREYEAIQYFVHDLLGSSPAALRIEALWNEYEERKTKEARLVKDLDRFELCLQAVEYERCE